MTDGGEGEVMDGGQPASFSRRMKKRRDVAARPPADLVAVELAAPLTPAGAGVLAQTLLKHLLFIRQQIPMPFDQLASGVKSQQQSLLEASGDGAQSRRRPQSSTFRKAMKMVESVEAILDGFKDLSRGKDSNLLGIVISFGPTPINPKESYILRVECRGDEVHEDVSATGLPACTADSNAQGAARKMIRSMISSGLDQMNDIAPAYKVFCLALVAPTGEAPGGDVQGAYAGWLARNGFVPKLRRCRPVIVTVGSKEFLATECPQHLSGLPPSVSSLSDPAESLPFQTLDNNQLVEMSVPEMLWLQHQTSIKGLQQQESCSDCL